MMAPLKKWFWPRLIPTNYFSFFKYQTGFQCYLIRVLSSTLTANVSTSDIIKLLNYLTEKFQAVWLSGSAPKRKGMEENLHSTLTQFFLFCLLMTSLNTRKDLPLIFQEHLSILRTWHILLIRQEPDSVTAISLRNSLTSRMLSVMDIITSFNLCLAHNHIPDHIQGHSF